jgi:hypothetical protein
MRSFIICTHLLILLEIKSKWMGWEEYVKCMGETICTYKILVENSQGKTPLGRSRHR